MAFDALWGLYLIQIDTTSIGGVTQQSIASGTELGGEAESGQLTASMKYVRRQGFNPGFTAKALATLLGALQGEGTTPAYNLGSATGLKLYAQKLAHGGGPASGAVHRKYAWTEGLLVPQTLSFDHQGDATLSVQSMTAKDGENRPLVMTDDTSLPAVPDGLNEEVFAMGSITLGGVTVEGGRNTSIDFGFELKAEGEDSDVDPLVVAYSAYQPTITLSSLNPKLIAATGIPLLGKAGTKANTTFYLRKRVHGSDFVANATEEHICITASGMIYPENVLDSSQTADGSCSVKLEAIQTVAEGVITPPLLINTASAIG